MSDENIQTLNFIILKSKKQQRGTLVAVVGILTKLKKAEIPRYEKLLPVVQQGLGLIFYRKDYG